MHVVYVDGKQVNINPGLTGNIDFNQVVLTPIPENTQVIAVSVKNIFMTFGGFRAAISDGSIVSDNSWKCSKKFISGWQNIDFDDSSWSAAATSGWADICLNFPLTAKFLWIDKFYTTLASFVTIYCRKSLSKFCFYTCVESAM